MKVAELRMLDIREASVADVVVSKDGKTLWVNIDGMCMLRLQGREVLPLTITDERDFSPH